MLAMRYDLRQPESNAARSNTPCSGFLRSLRWLMGLIVLTIGVGAPGLCLTHCAIQEYRHEHQAGLGDHGHLGAAPADQSAPPAPLTVAPPAAIYPAVLAALVMLPARPVARSVTRILTVTFASWIRSPMSPPPRLSQPEPQSALRRLATARSGARLSCDSCKL